MAREWTEEERAAIVASMVEAIMPPLREEGDFTLAEYIERLRTSGYEVQGKGPIRTRLEQQVAAGTLDKLVVWDNAEGGAVTVYRAAPARETG